MTVEHIEVLVEEPSMEIALRLLLPRLLGDMTFEVHPHQGKHDLLKKLPNRLRGYNAWLPPSWRILVLLDRDENDCHELKTKLERIASEAGLVTRTAAQSESYQLVNRLAVEELEAWYFGDWIAVQSTYPNVPARIPNNARYRVPDAIEGGTWEAFERILKKAGYFAGGLRKNEAARSIAPHIDPDRNSSKSFQVFRDVLREISH